MTLLLQAQHTLCFVLDQHLCLKMEYILKIQSAHIIIPTISDVWLGDLKHLVGKLA